MEVLNNLNMRGNIAKKYMRIYNFKVYEKKEADRI